VQELLTPPVADGVGGFQESFRGEHPPVGGVDNSLVTVNFVCNRKSLFFSCLCDLAFTSIWSAWM